MQIPKIISNIPSKLQNAYQTTRQALSDLQKKITAKTTAIFNDLSQKEFVKETLKPWFDRTIRPLTKTDYLLLVTSVALSALLVGLSLLQLGIASLPLSLCGAAFIIGGCGLFVQRRVRQHFNKIASGHLETMRKEAEQISNKNQNFPLLMQEQAILGKPEFSHLKDDFKSLEEETAKFRKGAALPTIDDKKLPLKAHLAFLSPLIQTNPQDKALLEALEQKLNAIGTPTQDLAAIETQKQKLGEFQTQLGKDHQLELKGQVDDLLKTAEGPDIAKIKETYIKYLEGLQGKLKLLNFNDI